MDLVVYDDDERRYVPWLVSVAAVVLAALLAAGVTFLFTGSSDAGDELSGGAAPQPATAPSPVASPEPSPVAEPEVVVTLSPSAAPSAAAPAEAAPSAPSAACTTALQQADAALTRSQAIAQALAEQTRIMDELLAQRITPDQALDQSLPVLTRGAGHRDVFTSELEAYESSRQACPD